MLVKNKNLSLVWSIKKHIVACCLIQLILLILILFSTVFLNKYFKEEIANSAVNGVKSDLKIGDFRHVILNLTAASKKCFKNISYYQNNKLIFIIPSKQNSFENSLINDIFYARYKITVFFDEMNVNQMGELFFTFNRFEFIPLIFMIWLASWLISISIILKIKQKLVLRYHKEMEINRFASIGQSTAMIAHDIRNPLSVIKSFFESNNRNNEEYIEAARRSTEKLRSIADNLLDYSKASKIAKTRFDFANAINTFRNEWRYLINGKDIQIEYVGPDNLIVDLDREKIGRVLGNLVANSIQALESKGLIKIELSSDAKNCLKIKVADNGKGIQKEDLPKLFELLFTKGKEGGTGLGLSYCKQVIEAHGGEITVESELGQGTTFTITIPDCVVKEQDVLKLDKKISGETNTIGKNQIMVIDDDKDILKKWEILIKEKGFEPITLTTTEGISKFDFSKVGTAIVDYKFNGSHLSGFDIIEFLQMKKIPKIHLCTAFFDDPSIKQKVIDMGITSLIPKPIPKDLPF